MSPQWMPQNLQKRLLLYILQQLLLFSEIDLPNLEEVSLSNIQLKDVSLDPEKVGKLPGCTLRFGELKTVEVKGGVVGGVNLNISGVDLVLATKLDDLDKEFKDMLALLAQSTANLANTVMFESDLRESSSTIPESESDSDSDSSKQNSSGSGLSNTSQTRPSALGGVMSRALEIALLRLQVNLSDVSIKVISESVDFLISIKKIAFLTNNRQHSVKVDGVKISTLRPNLDPGHGEDRAPAESRSDSESEEQDERSSEEDSADESLMSSTVFTHEEASSVYMSATAHSFAQPQGAYESSQAVHLVYIDCMDFEFEGLSPLSNLQINVDTVRLAAVPLTPTVSLVINSLAKLFRLKAHQLRKQFVSTRGQTHGLSRPSSSLSETFTTGDHYESQSSPQPDEPAFNKLHIGKFFFSLTSAISDDGDFASSDDELMISTDNINIKQKDESLIFGGIESFKVLKIVEGNSTDIMNFCADNSSSRSSSISADVDSTSSPSAQPSRADIRFEYFKPESRDESPEITILLSKSASIKLDDNSLLYLLNFSDSIQMVLENLNFLLTGMKQMKSAKQSSGPKPTLDNSSGADSQCVLQTSAINIELSLSSSTALSCKIFPITFNTSANNLSIQRITVESTINGQGKHLLTVPSINFKTVSETLSTYFSSQTGSSLRKERYFCNKNLHVAGITGSVTAEDLRYIKSGFMHLVSQLKARTNRVNALDHSLREFATSSKENKALNSLGQLMFVGQRRFGRHQHRPISRESESKHSASFSIQISGIDFTLFNIFPRFGDMIFLGKELKLLKVGYLLNGFIREVDVFRRHEQAKVKEPFFSRLPDSGPAIIFNHDTSEKGTTTDVAVRKFAVEYYTHWIQLFERNASQGHTTEDFVHATSPSASNQKKADLRFSFHEFVLGLHPGRLSSQIHVAVETGVSDFTFAKEQFYVKSSFRNLSLFLIDDWRNLKVDDRSAKLGLDITAAQYLGHRGFLLIGYINSTHVGVTVNTDIMAIKSRNDKLGIRGDLSLLDIKLNSDEHTIELCADSFQTLIQLLNDLKVPVSFKDDEKYRFAVDKDFRWPEELMKEIFGLLNQHGSSGDLDSPPPMPNRPDTSARDVHSGDDIEASLRKSLGSLDIGNDEDSQRGFDISFTNEHFRDNDVKNDAKILPMSLAVNVSKAKLYVFDGYDWKMTRKSLRQAVKNIEKKAQALRSKKLKHESKSSSAEGGPSKDISASAKNLAKSEQVSLDEEDIGGNDEINEVLFQSIHLGMAGELSTSNLVASMNTEMQAINMETAKDEALYPSLNVDVEQQYKELKLRRSRAHKVSIDVKNVEVYVHNYTNRDPRIDETPKGIESEMVNKVEVRIDSITVFDNVASSSWNKLLTYMSYLGEREIGTYMLQFTMMNVRPDPKLPYTEVIMSVKTLPVRLYIDQDTLMFLGRFFKFKDNRFNLPVDEPIFVQKLDISPIRLKFDYKPKSMNYSGFKAGQNAELANIFILDSADLSLAKSVVYGVLGFPKLGQALRDIYVPYIQKYQLAGLLSGLTPVKSLINIGEGFKNLVAVPFKDYQNNGQFMKSFQKSSKSFTKTATYELLKLGVKLASGTQAILESLEQYVGGEGNQARRSGKVSSSSKKARRDSNEFHTYKETDEKHNLLQASQKLKKSVHLNEDPHSDRKLYSVMLMDEVLEDEDLELDGLEPSVLVLDPNAGDGNASEDDELLDEEDIELANKIVSLYANQPTTTKEGLKNAYKSLGRNFKTTKKTIAGLSEELRNAEGFQEQLSSIARTSPVVVIRPMIGTTEAIMKTLMGLSNEIDPSYVVENQDKYGSESS